MVSEEFFRDTCLPDLLRTQVLARPDRIAVSCGADALTFRQLDARSDELGGYLRARGMGPDGTVGIFMEPSVDLAAAVWGTLYAGAAYLPLSPEYPDERLRYMLADSRTTVILADERLSSRLAGLAPAGTAIVTPEQARGHHGSGVGAAGEPHHLAYIIYTSGSTGRPKGIMIEHRSIVSQLQWLAAEQGLDERRVVLQKTPLSFDAAQWEILAPGCGSRVVMSEPGAYRDPERLLDLLAANEITTLQGVPTLLQALVDTGGLSRCGSLRQVFSGGEALSRSLAIELLEALPDIELVNLYGPSECTINTSAHTVDPQQVRDGPDTVSIGRPVHDTTYHVLDGNRAPVAVGATGELYIAGVQLARGYLHRGDLTAERFVVNPFSADPRFARLYRTGDLVRCQDDGTVQFVGRTDSQVKLRGFRVELDEIRVAIERHEWVKRAAVVVRDDPRTGANLVAAVEMNAHEAALMDQGNHGTHHQSKDSRLQIRAQLANGGCRDESDLAGRRRVELPGRVPTAQHRRTVFARKTYRFFEGGDVTRADIIRLLDGPAPTVRPRDLDTLTRAELGTVLRYFGQFHSAERLLPKYGYASPGSLYATQMYLELSAVAGLSPGYYYYHPVTHQLVMIRPGPDVGPRLRVHCVGRRSAIEPVYRNNIREVLEIETGHLVGLFDAVLPAYGLGIVADDRPPALADDLRCAAEDHHLGSFEVRPSGGRSPEPHPDVYVQAHPGRIADLPAGQYRYAAGRLERVSDDVVGRRHVIAINQQVYERASFGMTLLSRAPDPWTRYVDLGRTLQRLQMNDVGLGLMSSGYSSETGNDLPSARRIAHILGGCDGAASYFVVGGRVSAAQRRSEGMREDAVHMKGPAEMIRDDLAERLPRYMVPNRVSVWDALPLTVNGKVDLQAVRESEADAAGRADAPVVAPRTATEEAVAALWRRALKRSTVSVREDFFACGGNSLIAVGLISRINRELGSDLPLQVVFESSTIEQLALRVDRDSIGRSSRLVPLRRAGTRRPIFCWPGLGGYPMNLRLLAGRVHTDRPFLGIQAYGINQGELPYPTITEMAANDIEIIRARQPEGPYTLWGYSFGSRVAFEAAYLLEKSGERVEHLVCIAPGHPGSGDVPGRADVDGGGATPGGVTAVFGDPTFVAILFSVFAGGLDHPALGDCLAASTDEATFVAFVCDRFEHLECDLVRRIVGVVRRTFQFEYARHELAERRVEAPVTVFRARGDEDSFIENGARHPACRPTVVRLDADHYSLLRARGIDELVTAIQSVHQEEFAMPHVNIKHFPRTLAPDQMSSLVAAITSAVKNAFSCDESVVSIALESVAKDAWNERVYVPEIVNGKGSLVKAPNY